MIDRKFIDILRCPLGKSELKLENEFLICSQCGVKFPIRDGIPVLLMSEALLPEGFENVNHLICQNNNN
jgi:uncharacterized protein